MAEVSALEQRLREALVEEYYEKWKYAGAREARKISRERGESVTPILRRALRRAGLLLTDAEDER